LVRMWKEAVAVHCKVSYGTCLKGPRKAVRTSVRIAGPWAQV
jgi:hypothetical protein